MVGNARFRDCICQVVFNDALGTHDAVTREWLPEVRTQHVRLIVAEGCPMHPSVGCFACPERSVRLRPFAIEPGWAIRVDQQVAACPSHTKDTPCGPV